MPPNGSLRGSFHFWKKEEHSLVVSEREWEVETREAPPEKWISSLEMIRLIEYSNIRTHKLHFYMPNMVVASKISYVTLILVFYSLGFL